MGNSNRNYQIWYVLVASILALVLLSHESQYLLVCRFVTTVFNLLQTHRQRDIDFRGSIFF